MTDDTVELKPCPNPWCDGDRLLVIWDLFSRRVICNCGVKGPRSGTKANTSMGIPINDEARYVAEKEAREAWNTRPALTVEDSMREWLSKQPDIEWLGECYQPRFIMDALSIYKAALRAIADTPKEGE